MPDRLPLYPVTRRHLDHLSGELGVMQHAIGSEPDPAHGYCTDDVARALQVDLLHSRVLGWNRVASSVSRNLRFLDDSLDRHTGRFRNFRDADGTWREEQGSDDSHGRAMLALGETMAGAPDGRLAEQAERLFSEALAAAQALAATRARASVVLACAAAMRTVPTRSIALTCRIQSGHLRTAFESRSTAAWPWPEPWLTYENALPARALLVGGWALDSQPMIDIGVEILDWLVSVQTATAGHLSPIGNGWWAHGGKRATFDQQPIEATALLLAAESAVAVTGLDRYRTLAEHAYGWFLGANDVGVPVADPQRGASYDGLTPSGVNVNQGAESTLMWLVALEHTRSMRDAVATPAANPAGVAVAGPAG